ncbi:hypothetical protein D9757_008995 [Collybiopsis confluens]|uniref:Uncharacterized protein n=1 Tax=Collybiopsis confluens TaxID=2823264 RepID=A0A8H5LZX8_9AGAR|nr:hypothetical protein D9757_008995 [Collybiopsis confluens]
MSRPPWSYIWDSPYFLDSVSGERRISERTSSSEMSRIQSYHLFCSTCDASDEPTDSQNSKHRRIGSGTLLHTRSIQGLLSRRWIAKSRGVEKSVLRLDEEYFSPVQVAFCGDEPKINSRRSCGCFREGIGCSTCGSPLGTKITYCIRANHPQRQYESVATSSSLEERIASLEERISSARIQNPSIDSPFLPSRRETPHFAPVLSPTDDEILTFANDIRNASLTTDNVLDSSFLGRTFLRPVERAPDLTVYMFFPDAVIAQCGAPLYLPPKDTMAAAVNNAAEERRGATSVRPHRPRPYQLDIVPSIALPHLPISGRGTNAVISSRPLSGDTSVHQGNNRYGSSGRQLVEMRDDMDGAEDTSIPLLQDLSDSDDSNSPDWTDSSLDPGSPDDDRELSAGSGLGRVQAGFSALDVRDRQLHDGNSSVSVTPRYPRASRGHYDREPPPPLHQHPLTDDLPEPSRYRRRVGLVRQLVANLDREIGILASQREALMGDTAPPSAASFRANTSGEERMVSRQMVSGTGFFSGNGTRLSPHRDVPDLSSFDPSNLRAPSFAFSQSSDLDVASDEEDEDN